MYLSHRSARSGGAAASELTEVDRSLHICTDGDAALVDRAVTTLTYVVGDETKAIAAIFAL
jgi:acyl-ACP thioesterase